MDTEKPLDDIQKIESKKYGKSSFQMLLVSIFCFVSLVILSLFNPSNDILGIVMFILLLGFIWTNVSGFIDTIKSIKNKEPDTIFKTVGAIGNILLFLVMLSMVGFLLMDIVTWF